MTLALVAEDDLELRELAAVWLGAQGYDVVGASNGFAAIRLCAESRPDVVLLDTSLPDLDGQAVTDYIRAFSTVPILLLAASEESVIAALAAGANDYLLTPYDPIDLLDRVRQLTTVRSQLPGPRTSGDA